MSWRRSRPRHAGSRSRCWSSTTEAPTDERGRGRARRSARPAGAKLRPRGRAPARLPARPRERRPLHRDARRRRAVGSARDRARPRAGRRGGGRLRGRLTCPRTRGDRRRLPPRRRPLLRRLVRLLTGVPVTDTSSGFAPCAPSSQAACVRNRCSTRALDKKLDVAEQKIAALKAAAATKSSYGAKEMERDIWILWMGSLKQDFEHPRP